MGLGLFGAFLQTTCPCVKLKQMGRNVCEGVLSVVENVNKHVGHTLNQKTHKYELNVKTESARAPGTGSKESSSPPCGWLH